MKLIDVMTQGKSSTVKHSSRKDYEEAEAALDELETALKSARVLKRKTAEPMLKSLFDDFVQARRKSFKKLGQIASRLMNADGFEIVTSDGEKLRFEDPKVSEMRSIRTVELSDLRKAADALGYIILPYQYFDRSTLESDPEAAKNINEFVKLRGKSFSIYVLCPPQGYRPHFHLLDLAKKWVEEWSTPRNGKKPFHYEGEDEIYGFGLGSEILRVLIEESEDHLGCGLASSSNEDYSDGTKSFYFRKMCTSLYIDGGWRLSDRTMRWMYRYSVWLRVVNPKLSQKAAFKQIETEFEQIDEDLEVYVKAAREKQKKEQAERKAYPLADPIMFAVPKGTELTENLEAILGPCWGPDLGKELLALLAPFFDFKRGDK